jgi:hypothetical protein
MLKNEKLECLENFYSWVDEFYAERKVANYDLAVSKTFANVSLNPLEKIIWYFTIISRFERNAMLLTKDSSLEIDARKALDDYKTLNLSEYNLSEEDIEILAEDAKTTEKYFEWLDKKRAGD